MPTSYVGYKCPNCQSKVNMGIVSGEPDCPSCGTMMVPDTDPQFGVYAKVTCKKCGATYGLAISNNCGNCGEPFE